MRILVANITPSSPVVKLLTDPLVFIVQNGTNRTYYDDEKEALECAREFAQIYFDSFSDKNTAGRRAAYRSLQAIETRIRILEAL